MSKGILFEEFKLGELTLNNRVVMAPMTRSRAAEGDAPNELNALYYEQRASAGLIITEGTQPSAIGKGYCRTPGIHTEAQIDGWSQVCDAVHGAGGKLFMQLMHCGRVGSHLNKDPGTENVAPSAITSKAEIFTENGMAPMDAPRALELDEIPGLVDEYAQAARNAIAAGFDGVELHGASGYLPMQFMSTGTNQRDDAYGGSVSNRLRFSIEVLEAISAAIGIEKLGMRICPGNTFNDCHDDDPVETYSALLQEAQRLGLVYMHVIQAPSKQLDSWALAKQHFNGCLILNESLDFAKASQLVESGQADLVSFGRPFIGNPDLVEKFRSGDALAEFDLKTLYTPGAKGYTDY